MVVGPRPTEYLTQSAEKWSRTTVRTQKKCKVNSDVFKCSYKWCLPISVGMMTYKHWFLHYALLASENDLEKNQLFFSQSTFFSQI